MAGSDLDGDEYFVCWLDDLLFAGDNYPPMEFPPAEAQELDRPVQVVDMINYIKDSILNDQTGKLYNIHLKHADHQENGIFSEASRLTGAFNTTTAGIFCWCVCGWVGSQNRAVAAPWL